MNNKIRNARIIVLLAFFINGALLATWVTRIPEIQKNLSLTEATLGLTLLGISFGVLTALSLADSFIAKFGSGKVSVVGGVLMCIILPMMAVAPTIIVLWIALFVFGGAMSAMDVAINDQAIMVEKESQKPLMSSFHAAYSVGGLAGALIGAFFANIPFFKPFYHFLLIAFISIILLLISNRYFLPSGKREQTPQKKKSPFKLPERALWVLGLIAFSSSIGEGAMADWSAVYLSSALKTTASFAALGYAAFSITMTIGRLVGDRIIKRFNPKSIVQFGSFIATLGLTLAILTKSPYVVMIGFAAIGLGLANIVPIAFSAAGNRKGISASEGIAGVASIGYAGFLAGPPMIGFLAEATSIRIAFIAVAIIVGSLMFTSKAIKEE